MHPSSEQKKIKLDSMLDSMQAVVSVVLALKVPGGEYPDWWNESIMMVNISTGYPGMSIVLGEEGVDIGGLSTKGTRYNVFAPWAAIVRISRPDGSESQDWDVDPTEFLKPCTEHEGGPYLMELPWGVQTRAEAIHVVHFLMMQLGEMKPEESVRFVLAKPPRSAYTGLKLVVNNAPKSILIDPTSPAPNAA